MIHSFHTIGYMTVSIEEEEPDIDIPWEPSQGYLFYEDWTYYSYGAYLQLPHEPKEGFEGRWIFTQSHWGIRGYSDFANLTTGSYEASQISTGWGWDTQDSTYKFLAAHWGLRGHTDFEGIDVGSHPTLEPESEWNEWDGGILIAPPYEGLLNLLVRFDVRDLTGYQDGDPVYEFPSSAGENIILAPENSAFPPIYRANVSGTNPMLEFGVSGQNNIMSGLAYTPTLPSAVKNANLVAYWTASTGSGTILFDTVGDSDITLSSAVWNSSGRVPGSNSVGTTSTTWSGNTNKTSVGGVDFFADENSQWSVFFWAFNGTSGTYIAKASGLVDDRTFQIGQHGNTGLGYLFVRGARVDFLIPYNLNSWNCFLVTWDGSLCKVYVNGTLMAATVSGSAAIEDENITINSRTDGTAILGRHLLQHIAVWNTALTSQDAKTLSSPVDVRESSGGDRSIVMVGRLGPQNHASTVGNIGSLAARLNLGFRNTGTQFLCSQLPDSSRNVHSTSGLSSSSTSATAVQKSGNNQHDVFLNGTKLSTVSTSTRWGATNRLYFASNLVGHLGLVEIWASTMEDSNIQQYLLDLITEWS